MADILLPDPITFLEGIDPERVLAPDVSEDEYLERYAAHHVEWVEGAAVKMAPVTEEHDQGTLYLINLLQTYLELNPIGVMRREPFAMRAQPDRRRFREPDILVVLNEHRDRLTPTALHGAADLCIEVVSPGSEHTDYVTKFEEYQSAGVQEYWLIDTMRKSALFYRLGADGRCELQYPNANGAYTTPMFPKLRIDLAALWQSPPPGIILVVENVKAMMAAG